ncbi:ead/Ea22-like family protein [Salmonella enterica]|nr:ead/Ea22-like family protein [Salmonella enterica]
MSNIDKQAVTAKTKELASLMVERFSMNPVSCKLLNEAWKKEFPDEVAIAERMLALLDELEHYKSREERVTKLVLDNSTSWDALYKKLESSEKRIAELEARKVNLSKLSVGEVMHMSGFSQDYAEGWCAGNDNAIHEIRTAGIKVKG